MKRIPLWMCLGLIAWHFLFFWQYASGQQTFFFGDTAQFWYPTHVAYANALRAFQLPLWTPEILGGFPLFAEMQIGALYPPHLFLYFIFPTDLAVNYDILLHLAWMSVGMFLLARRLRIGDAGALFAAFVYSAGGMTQARVAHVNVLLIVAWLPWTIYFYERWRSEKRTRDFVALTLAFTFIILIGHPQFAALAFLIFFAWVGVSPMSDVRRPTSIFRLAISNLQSPISNLKLPLLALAFAVGLSALQLLPTYELAQLAARTVETQTAFNTSFSLHPLQTIFLVYPFALGNPYPRVSIEIVAYAGLLPLLLLSASVFVNRTRLTWFGIGLAALGIFLAFGGYNSVYRFLAEHLLPNFFRAPSRFLLFFYFVVPLVAGATLDRVLDRLPVTDFTRRAKILLAVFALVLAVTLGAGPNIPLDGWLALEKYLPFVLVAAAGGIAFAIWRNKISRAVALVLIFGFTAFDLAAFGQVYLQLYNSGVPRAEIASLPRVLDVVSAPESDARVYTSRWIYPWSTVQRQSLYPDLALAYGVAGAQGYTPLIPYYVNEYLTALSPENEIDSSGRLAPPDPCAQENRPRVSSAGMLNALNVRYYLVPQVLPATPACEGADVYDPFVLDALDTTISISATRADQLVVESSLAQSANLRNGDVVAEVDLTISGGQTITRALRAGIETAEWAYDRSDVRAQIQHSRPTLASTFPARSAIPVEAHDGHTYLAAFDLGGVDVTGLRIRPRIDAGLFHLASLSLVMNGQTINVAHLANASDQRLVYRSEDVAAFENRDAMPRAWLAHNVTVADDKTALARMQDADWNPTRENFIAEGETLAGANDSPVGETTRVVTYSPTRVVIDAQANSDADLILADAFYPGWVARVDGAEQPLCRADVMLRAVKISAGAHRVEFSYEPRSFQIGALVSGMTALLGVAVLIYNHRTRR